MGIDEEQSAPALVPVLDVLTDQGLQKFRFSRASAPADVEVFVAFAAGESESGVTAGEVAKDEVVAESGAHKSLLPSLQTKRKGNLRSALESSPGRWRFSDYPHLLVCRAYLWARSHVWQDLSYQGQFAY